jgi:ABC-type uncharacterized transport system substrate-binding protein
MVPVMIASRGFRRLVAMSALTLLIVLTPRPAAAHPHIFVEQHMEVLFDQNGITAVRMSWSFDEMYSTSLRADYTDTKTGAITAKDVKSLRDQHFAPVANRHFFATITVNGEPLKLDRFSDFTAKFVDEKTVYSFTIPVKPAKQTAKNSIEISVFDPEYYIDFELAADDPVKAIGGQTIGAACTNTMVPRDTVGWGQVDTDIVTCTYNGPAT